MKERSGGANTNEQSRKIADYITRRNPFTREDIATSKAALLNFPNVSLPETYNTILCTPELWYNVNGLLVTPSTVVKSVLVRRDGLDKERRLFSVFIADQKEQLVKNKLKLLSASNKERFQFWDKYFVNGLLINILYQNQHRLRVVNKIAYRLDENVKIENLISERDKFVEQLFRTNFFKHPHR